MIQILIAPIIAALIAQLLKISIKSNDLKFNWQSLTSYSGMPSSHSAMVISLTSSVGLIQGFNSPLFFVCIIFSFFIIRDALGLRRYIGRQSKILNNLVNDLENNKIIIKKNCPPLIENIGHTPAQILAGGLIGFLISYLSYTFFA